MASVAPSSRLHRIPLSGTQWIFLSLLVVSICINYIDRGSLSVADRYLQTDPDFRLDAYHRGIIYSAFFYTYAF
ncbi:MAG: MFS transporter, partial [Acidobacteriota bacterium]|nr:MFS transporter [Acidobacteriota bacterium]